MSPSEPGWRFPSWFPGLAMPPGYSWRQVSKDLVAALVVTLVLIPSAIAYSDLAKCPPAAGLWAALGGMVVFAFFTSSRHVINGPDAAIALMVGAAVADLGGGDPARAVAISTWLALLTGLLLVLAAWFKLGAAADFLANPVMLGFMNGAALVIIISQLGKLSGISLTEENSLLKAHEWITKLSQTHGPTFGLGLAFMAVLTAMKVWWRSIPGAIVVFTLALVAGRLIDFENHGFGVIGKIDLAIPSSVPPGLSLRDAANLLVAAIGLAFLVFPEGIVLGRSIATKHGYNIDPNRELIALGSANLAAGMLRGFAVGASQSRSLLNESTGGMLIFIVVVLDAWIASLPTVAIGAILTFTGFTLVDAVAVRRLRAMRRTEASIAMLTTLGVVALGVLPGVFLGVFLSLARLLGQLARPHDALLGRIDESDAFHDVGDGQVRTIPGLVVYRFYGPLIFANIRFFVDRLEHFIGRDTEPVRQVYLDASAIPEIDVTAVEELKAFIGRLHSRGIRFRVFKARLPLREAFASLGLSEYLESTSPSWKQWASEQHEH
ncbi:MAG TPA: SulP family inorganic anion transporter, partial [Gemmatales bacterium]|nr:SulP family inorganic anion transporter [Gemmatales bacterium]